MAKNLVPEQFKENQRLNRRLVNVGETIGDRMDVDISVLEERRNSGLEYEDFLAKEAAKAELDLVKADKDSFIMKYLRHNDVDTRKKIAESVMNEFSEKEILKRKNSEGK